MKHFFFCFYLIRRDLARHWRMAVLMSLILAISYIGLLMTEAFKESSRDFLQVKARRTLAADLAVSAFRPFTAAELERLNELIHPQAQSHEIELMTMVTSHEGSVLSEIKGVETTFPLIGNLSFTSQVQENPLLPSAWVAPEVLDQLDIPLGGTLRIGQIEFAATRVFQNDPGISQTSPGLSPRIYIPIEKIEATGLLQFGSQIVHRHSYLFKQPIPMETLRPAIESAIPQVFIRTPEDAIRGLNRFFDFFNRYLSAMALVVFVLAFSSAFYLFQIFLRERVTNSAIYLSFGASHRDVGLMAALQTLTLSWSAAALAGVSSYFLLRWIQTYWTATLPEGFQLSLRLMPLAGLLVTATLLGLVFAYPFLMRIRTMKPALLLNENAASGFIAFNSSRLTSYLPIVAVLWLLTWWTLAQWRDALIFIGAILAFSGLTYIAARGAFSLLSTLSRGSRVQIRLPLLNLKRGRFDTLLCLLTLSLIALVINIVPHLRQTLMNEIAPPVTDPRPSFFVVNIPEEEVSPLQSFLKNKGAELKYISPFILCQLTKINGRPSTQEWFTKFPVRVSYRTGYFSSEKVVEGPSDMGVYEAKAQALPYLSIERDFAKRNDLHIGDRLTFDIQGITVEGVVYNLRSVNWSSFQPNFFLQFQPGVLEDAPKTFMGTIANQGNLERKFQFELAKAFPNLSLINVTQTIDRVLSLIDKLSGPVQLIGSVAMVIALLLILLIVLQNLQLRTFEMDVYKTFGATLRQVSLMMTAEYFAVSLFAVIFGTGLGLVASFGIALYFLDLTPQISSEAIWFLNSILIALVTIAAWLAARWALARKRPSSLFG